MKERHRNGGSAEEKKGKKKGAVCTSGAGENPAADAALGSFLQPRVPLFSGSDSDTELSSMALLI